MKKINLLASAKVRAILVFCGITFFGLAHSGPPAQAYVDMRNAMCKSGGMAGALPYLTDKVKPFAMQMMEIESLTKGTREYEDTLAKQCYYGVQILNEIPVNNQRYIIRYRDSDGVIKEAAVSLEGGRWKVDL